MIKNDVSLPNNLKGRMFQSFSKIIDWRTEITYKLDQFGEGEGSRILVIGSGLDNHIDLTKTFGYNLSNSDPYRTDDFIGHTTFISGIIAGNGTHYVKGIAPKAELGVIKVVEKNKNFTDYRTIETALLWARDNLANVVLIDLDFNNPITLPVKNAIKTLEQDGVPVFINGRKNKDFDFTQYEVNELHESCWIDNWYKSTDEINFSIPIAVGLASLIRSKFKNISTDDVYNKIDSILVSKKSSTNRPKRSRK
ncbi:MAG: S8 family serine peptidase [Methanothrix sp.]|jgi:hypothetical protein|nr:S8 family serine peptidase [Methanothrix sp.]